MNCCCWIQVSVFYSQLWSFHLTSIKPTCCFNNPKTIIDGFLQEQKGYQTLKNALQKAFDDLIKGLTMPETNNWLLSHYFLWNMGCKKQESLLKWLVCLHSKKALLQLPHPLCTNTVRTKVWCPGLYLPCHFTFWHFPYHTAVTGLQYSTTDRAPFTNSTM